MTRVFVPNDGAGHDFTPAERLGELVYVTTGLVSRFDTGTMIRYINRALANSGPDDYIIITSLPVLCALLCSQFAALHGRLNLLLYNDGDYIERNIIISKE